MPKSKTKKRKLAHANSHPYTHSQPHHNPNSNENLSYEEIWDDSALVRSWNDAVAEYQFYHSIHARGEDVEEVLKRYHAENGEDGDVDVVDAGLDDEDEEGEILEDGEVEAGDEGVGEGEGGGDALPRPLGPELPLSNEAKLQPIDPATEKSSTIHAAVPMSLPDLTNGTPTTHHAPTTTQPNPEPNTQPQTQIQTQLNSQAPTDQTTILENIKMAYYWAGYYSGLHDAHQHQPSNQ